MNDFYSEHLVKKRREAKDVLIKAVMIILTLFCILFYRLMPLGIVVCALLIAADVYVFRMLDIEYEYMYLNGEVDIDMIIHKSRRKRMCTVNIKDAELIAPSKSPEMMIHKRVPALDYSSKMPNAQTYDILVNAAGVRKRIVFEPKKEVIEDMWLRAPRKVIRN